ncbi:10287_t:CDS:2 [Entrophospora sp. SA101]|nr:10287_t:CDS:2 [Entrophospora sp. SA101]CAJ0827298.1 878_t:CDS:2 [Entrophospora sp. SA101]
MSKVDIFLFISIFYFLSGVNAYTPLPGVYWYSYVLADTKLYFKTEESSNQLFYLDVSKPFNTTDASSIPWADITLNSIPIRDRDAACAGGINNSSIFLFGGNMDESDPYGLVAQYDIIQQQWKKPTISGIVPNNKPNSLPCTSTKDGSIYIFSTDGTTSVSEMNILNTISLTWSSGSIVNAPLRAGVAGFTATLLPDDTILYIGGEDTSGDMVSWDKLPLYDIKNDTWNYITTSGDVPSSRKGHTAILAPDDHIIIIGGSPVSQFIVLDIKTYEWSYPSIDSLNGRPAPKIAYHTATLLGKYILIGFGYALDTYQTDIYLMDISDRNNYRWTNLYDPSISFIILFVVAVLITIKILNNRYAYVIDPTDDSSIKNRTDNQHV